MLKMKNRNYLMMFAILLGLSMTFVSCEKDEDEKTPDVNAENIAGEYTKAITLDASVAYNLDGAMVIAEGGSLTIPAGTVIAAKGGTTSYIAIAQGATITINGTPSATEHKTSSFKETGSWGGLVICGKAPVNTGDGLSEVGNLPYGGTEATDNSGSITYLRVEYTGYAFTEEKQFNGVSFFGVGSGTQVSYVSSYKGNDDGIEFFGGAVNASYIVSIESQDDGIDFADGWSGTGSYWYSLNSAKSGIEGSNNGANGAATPMTHATLSNLTVYGMGEKPWFLKEGAGVQTIDNVVIGGLAAGKDQAYFYASGDDTDAAARIAAGDITVTNVAFVDMGEGNTQKAIDILTLGENVSATGAGNGKDAPTWAAGWSTASK
jgi:hypothetical protein